MKIINLEGLIGVGKSTLLSRATPQLLDHGIFVLHEPVAAFCSYKSFNPLLLAYENPAKHSAMTQLHIIQALKEHYLPYMSGSHPTRVLATERSLYGPIIFTKALEKSGHVTHFSAAKLIDLAYDNLSEMAKEHPLGGDKIFYIQAPLQVCFERIKKRRRLEEIKLTCGEPSFEEYLKDLEGYYLEHLENFKETKGRQSVCISSYDNPSLTEDFINFCLEK